MPEHINSCLEQAEITETDNAPIIDSGKGQSLSQFLCLLFKLLDENRIRYCVLHSWQTLPGELPSDLDLAVHPRDQAKLGAVFQGLLHEGYQPVQFRHRSGRGRRYDFVWFEPQGIRSASIDSIDEYVENGLTLISGEELVGNRKQLKGFWVANPEIEFAYVLAKKVLKGHLPTHQADRLKVLLNELGKPQAQKIAAELFGEKWKERVWVACAEGTLEGLLPQLKMKMWLTNFKKAPLDPLCYALRDIPRLIARLIKPIGLFLVILGPDGVGKSTLVGRLAQMLQHAGFDEFQLFHWRPNVIAHQRKPGVPVTSPHSEPPRGALGSILVLLGLVLDYWLGFILIFRPILTRAGLVIFDRYYHDLLMDPLRYRYGGPMWLVKFFSRFVPSPSLVFLVLDAGDDVIFSRKREVPLEELGRQRESYRQFAADWMRATMIKTDRGIDQTVEEATRSIVEYLTWRFQRRNARWLAPTP